MTSGVAVYHVGMDFSVNFGDSRSNGSRDARGTVKRTKLQKAETPYTTGVWPKRVTEIINEIHLET